MSEQERLDNADTANEPAGGTSKPMMRGIQWTARKVIKVLFREFALWLSIAVAVAMTMFAISINAGRINDLTATTAWIQEISERVAADPKAENVKKSLADLESLVNRKNDIIMTSNYGKDKDWPTPLWTCVITSMAPCFHKNSSAMNTIIIAFMSGIIGSGIFILRSLTAATFSLGNADATQPTSLGLDFRGFSRLLFGGIVGLLALFFMRGTKGVLLSPIVGMVQVENPYGTAFMSVVAVLFFDRFFDFLDRWMTQFKVGQEPTPADGKAAGG